MPKKLRFFSRRKGLDARFKKDLLIVIRVNTRTPWRTIPSLILTLIIYLCFEAFLKVVFTAFARWRFTISGVLKDVDISMKCF